MHLRKFLIITSLLLSTEMANAQSRFGEPATQADIDKSFWTVFPDGEFLPDGSGSAVAGKELFEYNCLICHNMPGETDPVKDEIGKLFGVDDKRDRTNLQQTIGSYWPYPTTIFDYVRRAMPLLAPMSLSNSDYYALTAYLLYENGVIAEDDIMNKSTLPNVEMPNKDGFINAYPEVPEKYKSKP
ncbi:MAG: c-type cytochrome [Emcibacteraceae bacterium]|nr:c-type cytochrome [Emcibacteraceae bacterium]